MSNSSSTFDLNRTFQSSRERKDAMKLIVENPKSNGPIQIVEFSFRSNENQNIQEYIKSNQIRPFLNNSKTFSSSNEFDLKAKLLFFGNQTSDLIYRDALDAFEKSLLISGSEKLNQLKFHILEGIKLMGFKNTKTNDEKIKVSYLYAINDNCNNLDKNVSTFPILLIITEKVIETKIIFAIDCKPGLLVDSAALKSNNINKIFKLFERKLKKTSEQPLVISKFSEYYELSCSSLEIDEFYYLKLALRLINKTNKLMENWKFVYDISKNQFFMKLSTLPLFPYHLNKKLPQMLTSEGIICYTSVVYGLSEIYKLKCVKGLMHDNRFKRLVKEIKQKLKKPVVMFTLNEDESQIKKTKQVILNRTEKDREIFEKIKGFKSCIKLFILKEFKKINENFVIDAINCASSVSLDFEGKDFNIKFVNQILHFIKDCYSKNLAVKTEDIKKEFFISDQKLYFKYQKSFSDFFYFEDKITLDGKVTLKELELIKHDSLIFLCNLYNIYFKDKNIDLKDVIIIDYNDNSNEYYGMQVRKEIIKLSEIDQVDNIKKSHLEKEITKSRILMNYRNDAEAFINRHFGYIDYCVFLIEDNGKNCIELKSDYFKYKSANFSNSKTLSKSILCTDKFFSGLKLQNTIAFPENTYIKITKKGQIDQFKMNILTLYEIEQLEKVELGQKIKIEKGYKISKFLESLIKTIGFTISNKKKIKVVKHNQKNLSFSFKNQRLEVGIPLVHFIKYY